MPTQTSRVNPGRFVLLGVLGALAASWAVSCQGPQEFFRDTQGNGGGPGTGGSIVATGGSVGTGGVPGTGGKATGGVPGTGGKATGGVHGTGGIINKGGVPGTSKSVSMRLGDRTAREIAAQMV